LGVKTDLFSRIEEGKSFIAKTHKRVIDKINCHYITIATTKNSKLIKMFGWLSFSVWKCLSQSSLFVIIYCVIVNGQDYGYNNNGEIYLGSFNKLTYHPVQGDLYLKDAQTLVIRNFVYDGEGPDAFFVVGKRPMRRNRVVIRDRRDAIPIPYESQYPYPPYSAYSRQATSNQGGSYLNQRLRYDDPDIPVLGRFEGQDIELNMPEGVDAEKIRWISLYCRQFNMDFGHVMIDDNPWGRPRTS